MQIAIFSLKCDRLVVFLHIQHASQTTFQEISNGRTVPEQTPKKPEYLIAATYLGVRWDLVPFNFDGTIPSIPNYPPLSISENRTAPVFPPPTPCLLRNLQTRRDLFSARLADGIQRLGKEPPLVLCDFFGPFCLFIISQRNHQHQDLRRHPCPCHHHHHHHRHWLVLNPHLIARHLLGKMVIHFSFAHHDIGTIMKISKKKNGHFGTCTPRLGVARCRVLQQETSQTECSTRSQV